MATMCDKGSLNWCGRITLLMTICGILCVMMFQIWSYYYSLVTQMDEMVLESPQVHGVLNMCEGKILRSWNVDSCNPRGGKMLCILPRELPATAFVNAVGTGEIFLNGTVMSVEPATACIRIMLWILPW
tara:strand:- start:1900 stop:2286 length:387 start_codon:yes stop_codon:yes gene_type:complete